MAVSIRLKLLESLVLPILFYGAGSWSTLPFRLFQRLEAVIMRWQRQIIGNGFWSETPLTDAELRAFWQLPCLGLRLIKHRLLFAIQLHRHAPHVVWDTVTAADTSGDTSWLAAVRRAAQWYLDMNGISDVPMDTTIDVLQWLHSLPAQAPKAIRRAVSRQLLQEHAAHRVLRAHREIKALCLHHGVQFDDVLPQEQLNAVTFSCPDCCKSFSTIQGLNAHRWKQHQQISEERSYVFSSTCLSCGRCFWTAQRLQQHLRYSRKYPQGCLWWLKQHIQPTSTSEPIRMPEIHHGRLRLPWTCSHGPLP